MAFNFDYRALTMVLAAGESRPFDALRYLAVASTTAAVELAPRGKAGSYGPFQLKQVLEEPSGGNIGPVEIRNPTGGAVTVTVVTSNARVSFSDAAAAQSISIDGVSVTVPISIAANIAVVGAAAHDAVVAGAPVLQGAEALSTERAAVANGDAVRLGADLHGRQLVAPHATVDDRVGASVAIAAIGVVDLVPAQAAGLRFHLTSLVVGNEAATPNTLIVLAGATELFRVTVPANDSRHLTFPVPEHTGAAEALRINVTAATAMRAAARGYKGA